MRSLSASICVLSVPQSSAAANGRRTRAPNRRTRRGGRPGAQRVQQHLGRRAVEILVNVVVDLKDRRVDAGAETLDLDERKETVRRGPADADAKLTLARADHLIRAAQPARGRRARLEQIASNWSQVEHRVKGCDLINPDRRHFEQLRDAIHRRPGQPSSMLALRQIQQRQHRARLTPSRVFGDVGFRPLEVLLGEIEARGLLELGGIGRRAHRSISPNTMSIEPMIATTSASIWPRVMKSVAWRKAKPGDLILQRYGRLVPSETR